MSAPAGPGPESIVYVLPPSRRDGEVTCSLLARAGIECVACKSVQEMAMQVGSRNVGAIVLTDFALADARLPVLLEALSGQPNWSDIPVVLLSRESAALRPVEQFSNLTVLDRPTSTRTMVSAVRAALRARQWQYRIRDQLVTQERAEQALRDADQRKDEFLATLAHELRNPLAPIRTGLEVLNRAKDDPATTERIRQMMGRQIAQLVRLIDDLLDISRIATGKVVLQRERVDLRTVVTEAIEACQSLIDRARHTLHLSLPDAPVWTQGDAPRLGQVVSNLVNNATKYTPAGGSIEVALSASTGEAVLTVEDSGAGIPAEMLDDVFDMFTQVNQTLDRSQGGLGIGLSLVRRLVDLHGGTVSARSEGLGRGSCFTIHLPIAKDASEPAAPIEGLAHGRARPLRILIVDDNQDAADSLSILLEEYGHTTRTAYSGAEALTLADELHPQVVLCDIGLPGMGGHEVAARLRASSAHAASILVAVTGWGSENDRVRTSEAGFDHHLVKPVDLDAIEEILLHA